MTSVHARNAKLRSCIRPRSTRSEEHTSELQSQSNLVCRLLLEKKKQNFALLAIMRATPCSCMMSRRFTPITSDTLPAVDYANTSHGRSPTVSGYVALVAVGND